MLYPIFEAEKVILSHKLISAKDMLYSEILVSSPHIHNGTRKDTSPSLPSLYPNHLFQKKPNQRIRVS